MSGNTFHNDGSFFEQFKRMQEEQQKKADPPAPAAPAAPAGLSIRLAPRQKAKQPLRGVGRLKPSDSSARRAFGGDSDSDGEQDGEGTIREDKDVRKQLQAAITCPPPPFVQHPSQPPPSQPLSAQQPSQSTPSQPTPSQPTPSQPPPSLSTTSLPPGSTATGTKRKRPSRWSSTPSSSLSSDQAAVMAAMASFEGTSASSSSSSSSQQLTPSQEQQLREQMEMNKIVAEVRAAMAKKPRRSKGGKSQYDYDSDEEVEGGTWEHKARTNEMMKTIERARQLTDMGKGKHHIADFLPPDELSRFIERVKATKDGRAADLSDYLEHKLTEDNVGYQMLQRAGWEEGAGLGSKAEGITAPINKGKQSFDQSGVGMEQPGEVQKEDDEFELYRKRMMLAYRFRPNPLNNPRRPYY